MNIQIELTGLEVEWVKNVLQYGETFDDKLFRFDCLVFYCKEIGYDNKFIMILN